jgi:Protein of unknown function (DUF3800)
VKIFIDESGGFSWTTRGVSLFCAVTISDKDFNSVVSAFDAWKRRQPRPTRGSELKGTDLNPMQQASFVNSVILSCRRLRLTLAGTKTTLFKREIAEQYIKDSAAVLLATAESMKHTDRPKLADFFTRMANWMRRRNPEQLMWLFCLGDAICLSFQHAIVLFAEPADDYEFEKIEILIDQSFIEKSTEKEFWQEWLRMFLYNRSVKKPLMTVKEWSERDHPFNKKFKKARGVIDLSDLFRNNLRFGKSDDSSGIQIADISANICYRHYSGKPKYRPYRLLRSRTMGEHNSEIHYAVLNESSLLTDAPENHVHDYSEEEIAAMDEIAKAKKGTH